MRFFSSDCPRDEAERRERETHLEEISGAGHQYWSKEWGVNYLSVLIDVPHFE